MTKKDYELIAGVLKDYNPYKNMSARDNFEILCFDMSAKLQAENPKFNREKFLTACGVVEVKNKYEELADKMFFIELKTK